MVQIIRPADYFNCAAYQGFITGEVIEVNLKQSLEEPDHFDVRSLLKLHQKVDQ